MIRMNRYPYMTLVLTVMLFLAACTSEPDEVEGLSSDTSVTVNTSRAEGEGGGDFLLMFWTGTSDVVATPFFHSLADGTDDGQVDYYHYDVHDYPVKKDGESYAYPSDDSRIYAVGYSPNDAEVLTRSADYKTLTLTDPTKRGLVDVLSTQTEWGTESAPFTSDKEKELQFKHTQVKVNFKVNCTKYVTGTPAPNKEIGADYITNVKVGLSADRLADTWNLNPEVVYGEPYEANAGFVAFASDDEDQTIVREFITPVGKQLPVQDYSEEEWLDLQLSTDSNQKECYLLHYRYFGAFGAPGSGAYISLPVYAEWVRGFEGTVKLNYQGNKALKVPLYNGDGTPFKGWVQPGDAYTIYITFDYNRIDLWAQKLDWKSGGNVVIPINPTK